MIGIAGDVDECLRWMDWYLAGKQGRSPKLRNSELLLLRRTGLFHTTGGAETKIDRGWHAIGSGAMAAITAYTLGLTLQRALRVAREVDPESGGRLVVRRLPKPKKGAR